MIRIGSSPPETEERDVIALSTTGGVAANGIQDRLTDLADFERGGGKGLLQKFDAKQRALGVSIASFTPSV